MSACVPPSCAQRLRQAGRTAAITVLAARAIIDAPCSREASVSMDCSMPSVSTAAMTKAKGRAVLLATGDAVWKLVFMVISWGCGGWLLLNRWAHCRNCRWVALAACDELRDEALSGRCGG
jgi:hypothetical protein